MPRLKRKAGTPAKAGQYAPDSTERKQGLYKVYRNTSKPILTTSAMLNIVLQIRVAMLRRAIARHTRSKMQKASRRRNR